RPETELAITIGSEESRPNDAYRGDRRKAQPVPDDDFGALDGQVGPPRIADDDVGQNLAPAADALDLVGCLDPAALELIGDDVVGDALAVEPQDREAHDEDHQEAECGKTADTASALARSRLVDLGLRRHRRTLAREAGQRQCRTRGGKRVERASRIAGDRQAFGRGPPRAPARATARRRPGGARRLRSSRIPAFRRTGPR